MIVFGIFGNVYIIREYIFRSQWWHQYLVTIVSNVNGNWEPALLAKLAFYKRQSSKKLPNCMEMTSLDAKPMSDCKKIDAK